MNRMGQLVKHQSKVIWSELFVTKIQTYLVINLFERNIPVFPVKNESFETPRIQRTFPLE